MQMPTCQRRGQDLARDGMCVMLTGGGGLSVVRASLTSNLRLSSPLDAAVATSRCFCRQLISFAAGSSA